MIVELYAQSDVGRVRRGNEDNFLILDLSNEQTWTGADGAKAPWGGKAQRVANGLMVATPLYWLTESGLSAPENIWQRIADSSKVLISGAQ